MKIIDLLNKIANGEEVPKWVVYDKKEYTYMEEYKDYVHTVYNNGTMLFLLSEIFNKNGIDIVLNQELDFIEEDKKIEKLELVDDGNTITLFSKNDEEWTILDNVDVLICDKINEIIDKLNELDK